MTSYHNGAFEALTWAWRMLRDKEIQEGRDEIHAVLMRLGKSEKIDFNEFVDLLHAQRDEQMIEEQIKDDAQNKERL